MTVNENLQKKVCLQYVLVNNKKYKTIMYSTADLEGSPNYLRVRSLKNTFDLLLNVGNLKFVYLRHSYHNLEWYNQIRETHLMYQLYPSSDSMNKICVDFQHEVMPTDEKKSLICFLCKSDQFYMINICSLYFCPEANSYKIKPFRELSVFTSPVVYSSLLFNFNQNFTTIAGIGYSSSGILTRDEVFINFFTKVEIPKIDSKAEDAEVLEASVALPYTKEVIFIQEGENPETMDNEERTKRLESIPIKMVITHVNQGDSTTRAPSFTSSLYAVGEEHLFLQPLQLMPATQRIGTISLEGLPLVDSRLTPSEWNKLKRTYISSLSLKVDSVLSAPLAVVAFAVSKGIIATLRIKAPMSF